MESTNTAVCANVIQCPMMAGMMTSPRQRPTPKKATTPPVRRNLQQRVGMQLQTRTGDGVALRVVLQRARHDRGQPHACQHAHGPEEGHAGPARLRHQQRDAHQHEQVAHQQQALAIGGREEEGRRQV